jgi:folate-binding Fe-S cluster repair protein YgfZ
MGKPNSHQPLELWDVHTFRSGIEALPEHIIEEFIPDTLNCVGTPQTSSRNH